MLGLPVMWDSFSHLEAAVRTGRPGTEFVDPAGFFAYLDAHPGESDAYDRGMTAMTVRRIARTVPHYDFTPYEVIADIGGGRGHLLRAVLEAAPEARGVIFDRAQVVDDVAADPRIEVRSGSFFTDALPTADCYLLSNIIHDWSDQDAVSILTAVRAAASPSSTLLLFEWVVPDDGVEFEATDIDVFMLAPGRRPRTHPRRVRRSAGTCRMAGPQDRGDPCPDHHRGDHQLICSPPAYGGATDGLPREHQKCCTRHRCACERPFTVFVRASVGRQQDPRSTGTQVRRAATSAQLHTLPGGF